MPTVALDAWKAAWKPRSDVTVSKWGRQHVKLPWSARSPDYDDDQSYWLRAPLDAIPDTSLKEIVVIGPPGSSKTTLFEVGVPYCIVEEPGDTLILNHTVPMTDAWFESRGKVGLKACAPVMELWPKKPNKDKTDTILFDHMTLWTGGANDSDTQSRSCRWVWGDEVWKWKQRIMREARARLHDRWNAKCIFVSQGGDEKIGDAETELFAAYTAGTMEVANFTCTHCGTVQPWDRNKGLRYDETKDENGVWDYDAAAASARWVCAHPDCQAVFKDDIQVRRQLSSTLEYVVTNPGAQAKIRSFQYNAYCVWWISWGTLAVEWIKANEAKHRGDFGPLKTYIQKREASFWSEEVTVPHGALRPSGYSFQEFMAGELVPGEILRPMTVDKQKDHFIVAIRAWLQDGSSKLLWEGRINTETGLRDLQLRYKVQDGAVFIDARYEPSDVYALCARFNWTAVMGEEKDLYTHHPRKGRPFFRYFSPMERVFTGANGHCYKINFGNKPIKDILSRLRGGHGPKWEVYDDVSEVYRYQIDSEVVQDVVNKATKQITSRWVKIRPNHRWDVEVLQVLAACILNLIGEAPPPPPEAWLRAQALAVEHGISRSEAIERQVLRP